MRLYGGVNSDQFRRYLAGHGCTFEPGRGGHLNVYRGERRSYIPQHGGAKQLGLGLMRKVKKDLGIDGSREEAMRLCYPGDLSPDDNDTILVIFPDLPGATFGEDEAEALANAVDALETILGSYVNDRLDIPKPSPANGRPTVSLTLLGSLKVAVYEAMRARGWRKVDLARAMGRNPRQIDRLLDLRHASTVAQLEQALRECVDAPVCRPISSLQTETFIHAG